MASSFFSHIHIESNCISLLCYSKGKVTINSRICHHHPIFSSKKWQKSAYCRFISFSTHQPRIETALLPHLIVVLCIVGDGICYRVRYHPISHSTYITKNPLSCREEVLLHNHTTTPVHDIADTPSRKVLD